MGWFTQSNDGDVSVEVKAGESQDRGGEPTTELLIIDHSSSDGAHEHVVIDSSGGVVHDTTGSL